MTAVTATPILRQTTQQSALNTKGVVAGVPMHSGVHERFRPTSAPTIARPIRLGHHLRHDGLNGNIWLHREVPGHQTTMDAQTSHQTDST